MSFLGSLRFDKADIILVFIRNRQLYGHHKPRKSLQRFISSTNTRQKSLVTKPRTLTITLAVSGVLVTPSNPPPPPSAQMPPQPSPRLGRDRSHTISVMSPTRRAPPSDAGDSRLGLLPEQVLLQLFHSPELDPENPYPDPPALDSDVIMLENGPETERTLAVFDRITPMETHKIGVLYVGVGQAGDEPAILRNQCGSVRYNEFLKVRGWCGVRGGWFELAYFG